RVERDIPAGEGHPEPQHPHGLAGVDPPVRHGVPPVQVRFRRQRLLRERGGDEHHGTSRAHDTLARSMLLLAACTSTAPVDSGTTPGTVDTTETGTRSETGETATTTPSCAAPIWVDGPFTIATVDDAAAVCAAGNAVHGDVTVKDSDLTDLAA